MKKIISNYRYWILATLAFASIIMIATIPQDTSSIITYMSILVGSKILSIILAYLGYLLYNQWQNQCPELKKIIEED